MSSKTQANILRLVKAVQKDIQCAIVVSKIKGVFSKNPVLKPCSYCLGNKHKCFKLGISMYSESRNQTAQDIFKEDKLSGQIDSQLTYCETFTGTVHFGKKKR